MKAYLVIFFISFILLFSYSCKNSINEKEDTVEANIEKLTDNYEIEISSNQCGVMEKNVAVLFFESNFRDDKIQISVNKKELFEEQITTDNKSGLAKEFNLGRFDDINEIDFKINNGQVVNLKELKCNFIFVNYKRDSLVAVTFSNKFIPYN